MDQDYESDLELLNQLLEEDGIEAVAWTVDGVDDYFTDETGRIIERDSPEDVLLRALFGEPMQLRDEEFDSSDDLHSIPHSVMVSPMKISFEPALSNVGFNDHAVMLLNQAVGDLPTYGGQCSVFRGSDREFYETIEEFKMEILYMNGKSCAITKMVDEVEGETECAILYMSKDNYDWRVTIMSTTVEFGRGLYDRFGTWLRPITLEESTQTYVFRHLSADGSCTARSRVMQINKWNEIGSNYPAQLAEQLEELMGLRLEDDAPGGKLVLWHGPPGGGKTNAIRALTHAWRDWVGMITYVVDPEAFFERPYYMLDTMIAGGTKDWHLVILEDAGQYLSEKAFVTNGHGMARLLNLTDGLVGQGTKLLILITTNEPLAELHKAVTREGRCLSEMSFDLFNKDEANVWLKDHEVDYRVTKETSLADLFSMYNGPKSRAIRKSRPSYETGGYA